MPGNDIVVSVSRSSGRVKGRQFRIALHVLQPTEPTEKAHRTPGALFVLVSIKRKVCSAKSLPAVPDTCEEKAACRPSEM